MADDNILVVDDNPQNSKLVSFLLARSGYAVRTAANADEALAAVATRKPALILMDLQLPGVDGLALTRVLKADESTRDIVVVALTAYAMKGDEERALGAGCAAYVTKPIDTRSLPVSVAKWLSEGGRARGGAG